MEDLDIRLKIKRMSDLALLHAAAGEFHAAAKILEELSELVRKHASDKVLS